MKSTFVKYALALLVAIALFNQPSLNGQEQQTIVSSGTSANGDGSFNSFYQFYLNDDGDVSFGGRLTGTSLGSLNDRGVFFWDETTGLQAIARESDIAADGVGQIASIQNLGMNSNGHVLLHSAYNTGSSNDSGVSWWNGSSHQQIMREGDRVYGGNGNYGEAQTEAYYYGFADNGSVSFYNEATGSSGGASDDSGIYRNPGFPIREGQTAPGGATFEGFGWTSRINNTGETAFSGQAGGLNGLFRTSAFGSVTRVYGEGDAATDGNGELRYTVGAMSLNNQGDIAFKARFRNTAGGFLDDYAVYRTEGDSLRQIVREGDSVVDGNGIFSNFVDGSIRVNEHGQVAFSAKLRDTRNPYYDDTGIFVSDGSGYSPRLIARAGQQTDTNDGYLADLEISGISFNDQGQVAFKSALYGTSNNTAVLIGDGEELITVAQEGQSLAGSTIRDVNFYGGEKHQSGLNNFGQVVYEAELSDGRHLLQRWTPDLHWRTTTSNNWDRASEWTLGIDPSSVHRVFIDPQNSLTVNGPTTDTTVKSLKVGGGSGIATLKLQRGSRLTALQGVAIESTGVLTGDGIIDSFVSNYGRIEADNVSISSSLYNFGVISGNGRLSANIVNISSGEVRVESGESLRLSGPTFANEGKIEILGGELEVDAFVQNQSGTGLITGRNATVRFGGGVYNQGAIAFSYGVSDVFGDINNDGGQIVIGGGAEVTFYDDIVQNGTLEVAGFGTRTGSAVLFGDLSGAGGFSGGGDVFLLGDLRPGNSPASVMMEGSLYLGATTMTEIEIAGLETGSYDQFLVSGNLGLAGDLTISLLDDFMLDKNQEFLIADIGGELSGQFRGLNEGDLVGRFGGQSLFISYSAGDGNDISLWTVPEPGAAGLLAVFAVGLLSRRRTRHS